MSYEAKVIDRAQARERMRRLRSEGPTPYDRAYRAARAELIDRHRAEFDSIRRRILEEGS